jgi:uncharacterized protein (TIGR03067 family)
MIQFGLGLIDFAFQAGTTTPRDRSVYVTSRGIIMMSVKNRMAMSVPATGLTLLLSIAIGAGLGLGLGTASALGDDKPQSELLKPFLGTWTSSGDGLDSTWTFEGEKVKASVNGMDYTCKAKIDADAKPFATIDLLIDDGPEDAKGKTSKGIYKIDGEKLTLCVSAPGKDRPKEFAQAEDAAYLFELKKQKKE